VSPRDQVLDRANPNQFSSLFSSGISRPWARASVTGQLRVLENFKRFAKLCLKL
jgi:hypothetical protein